MLLVCLMVVIPQLRWKLHSYKKKKEKKILLNGERKVNYEHTTLLSCNFLLPLLSWRFFSHRDKTNGGK